MKDGDVKCTVCRLPMSKHAKHIAGIQRRNGATEFRWACSHHLCDEATIRIGSNACLRRFYTHNPQHKATLKRMVAS